MCRTSTQDGKNKQIKIARLVTDCQLPNWQFLLEMRRQNCSFCAMMTKVVTAQSAACNICKNSPVVNECANCEFLFTSLA